MNLFSSTRCSVRALTAALGLAALITLAGCGEYGPPIPSVVERPTIPPAATPVYEWQVDRVNVAYYWYKVNKYDITVKARGYFPAGYKTEADAIWEVEFHTLATPDLPSVPGQFLGAWRTSVDATGATIKEIVPPVNALDLKDGMYGVMVNGVEFDKDNPEAIKAIRPVMHILMVKENAFDPHFDMPLYLTPVQPSELTPLPTFPDPKPETDKPALQSIPIPGMPGAGM